MGNRNDCLRLASESSFGAAPVSGPQPGGSADLTAIAEGLGSLARSVRMLSLNAAIVASRSGAVSLMASEIKRVAVELEALTLGSGKEC